MKQNRGLWERLGFRYAWQGIRKAVANEFNFRIHLIAAVLVILSGLVLRVSLMEWLFLMVAIMAVFITELLNTAIEKLCDLVSNKHDRGIGLIKDVAASAVLVAAIFAAIVGLLIFVPKLLDLFRR